MSKTAVNRPTQNEDTNEYYSNIREKKNNIMEKIKIKKKNTEKIVIEIFLRKRKESMDKITENYFWQLKRKAKRL